MRTWVAACALLLGSLAACGGEDSTVARDPGSPDDPTTSDSDGGSVVGSGMDLTGVPPADGTVATRDLATVLDTGDDPQLCLGAVAESFPPQCSGVPLVGWHWSEHDGVFEESGDVRWGLFHVTGTFDGSTLTVASAIPAALYSPPSQVREPGDPAPGGDNGSLGPAEDRVLAALEAKPVPGTLSVTPTAGSVLVHVVHDDGSLQQAATRRFGGGAVTIRSALVPLRR